jgi:hypothetical protein
LNIFNEYCYLSIAIKNILAILLNNIQVHTATVERSLSNACSTVHGKGKIAVYVSSERLQVDGLISRLHDYEVQAN